MPLNTEFIFKSTWVTKWTFHYGKNKTLKWILRELLLVLNYHVTEVNRTTILIFKPDLYFPAAIFAWWLFIPPLATSHYCRKSKDPVLLEEYALPPQFPDSEEGATNPNYLSERLLVSVITNDQSRQFQVTWGQFFTTTKTIYKITELHKVSSAML